MKDLVQVLAVVALLAGLVVAGGVLYFTYSVPGQTRTGLEGDY